VSIMNAKLLVTMPDRSVWAVPVSKIAESRAKFYAEEDEEFGGSFERSLAEDTIPVFESDDYDIKDWAAGNMNWSDVEQFAILHSAAPSLTDDMKQDGWMNGAKTVLR